MTIYYLTEPSKPKEILEFLTDEIKEWFTNKFPAGFTPPQLYAIPSIHKKQNTLIFSSTGSGKTFAAFLAGINELFIEAKKGELKDQIYILYVSPLKALGNDIRKNLEEPLKEIQELAALNNQSVPKIRVHVRTGDTTQAERSKMLRKPPHILITTPESLGLILTSPKFSLHLKHVRWIIIDEIHEISNNKRGVLLSLFLEYLQNELIESTVTRIGLSATQAPIEEIARFLVGISKNGKESDCYIANIPPLRRYDLAVISPVNDLLHTPFALIQEGIYGKIADMIINHETSIIFTNTRRGAESVAFKLKERLGEAYAPFIAVHHSSLSRDIRLDVEDRLKNNELLAVISSTSLELGIDIGSVELVGQIGSPKSVAKYLQRVGRSGHSITETAKGRLIVTDRDDAIECAVLTRSTYVGDIDKVQIPKNCLDVLAQFLVGISLIKRWNVNEAYEIIKCSYNYANLKYEDYIDVLEYLGGYKLDVSERKVYRKIWYDKQENAFGKKRNSRLIFYTNIGTIPESADYFVELETYRTRLGKLSENFVERLTPGDIFVLGSHTYQFKRTAGSRVIVSESLGKRPTVPSWVGEMLPRSFELSQQIGKFISAVAKKIQEKEDDIEEWIKSSFLCDEILAKTIVEYVNEQIQFLNEVPSDKTILIESFMDPQNRQNIVFHAYFGRRVNDALSKAFAYAIGKTIKSDVGAAVNDNGFLLILPTGKLFDTSNIPTLVTSANLETLLKDSIRNTELFQTRFRHVANRALMILRNSGQRPVPVSRQTLYARRILDSIKMQDDFCIIKETFREILRDYMDLTNATYVLRKIEEGEYSYKILPMVDIPSPFAHGIVLMGATDVVQLADRTALLRELHQQVMSKIFAESDLKETIFDKKLVDRIFQIRQFKDKSLPITTIEQLYKAIDKLAPIKTLEGTTPSIYQLALAKPEQVDAWVIKLYNTQRVVTIPLSTNEYRTIPKSKFALFWNIYVRTTSLTSTDEQIVAYLEQHRSATIRELAVNLNLEEADIKQSLKKLEQAFIVTQYNHRKQRGRIVWEYCLLSNILSKTIIKYAKSLDPEECLKTVVENHLKIYGPKTVQEIAAYLKVEEDKIIRALEELKQENRVLEGYITSPVLVQYICLEDREILRELTQRSFDKILLRASDIHYLHYYFMYESFIEQELKNKADILAILNTFGILESLHSITVRMEYFELEWFKELISSGEIIQGRFRYGKIGYVTKEQFPYYYVAYRDETPLNEIDKTILNTIEKLGPLTRREIVDYTGLDEDMVKESLAVLDKSLHLVRVSVILEPHKQKRRFTPNIYDLARRYLPVNNLPSAEQSREFIVLQLIKAFGPISIVELTNISGLKYTEVESVIKKLTSQKKIIEKMLTKQKTNYYMTQERYEQIKTIKRNQLDTSLFEKNKIALIPRDDPLTKLGIRARLREAFGEGFVAPILYDSQVIGSVEYKLYHMFMQIYDMRFFVKELYDPLLIQQLALDLISYARKNHQAYGVHIEEIDGASILAEKNNLIREIFLATGYKLVNGVLIGGETVAHFFNKKVLYDYLVEILGLKKYRTCNKGAIMYYVLRFGWISYQELRARFPETSASILSYLINQLIKEKQIIYQDGIVYSLQFAKYKKSGIRRRRRLKEEYLQIYKQIKSGTNTPLALKEINQIHASQLHKALETLQNEMYIAAIEIDENGEITEYQATKTDSVPQEVNSSLKKQYLLDIIDGFGVMTEEQLINRAYIPGVLSKIAVKEILNQLLQEESILSGRFIEDSLNLFYITKAAYDELLRIEKSNENTMSSTTGHLFLLAPSDFAIEFLRPFFPMNFSISSKAYLAIINGKIAAQIVIKDKEKQKLVVENIILANWIDSEQDYQYLITTIDLLKTQYFGDTRYVSIQKINGIKALNLVK